MQRRTTYEFVYFSADVLREAYRTLRSQVDSEGSPEFSESFEVNVGDSTWSQDSLEEFLADYRKGSREAYFYARSEARPAVQMIVSVFGSDDAQDYQRYGNGSDPCDDRDRIRYVR